MPEILLQTKLFVPPLRPLTVPRPNLIQKLNTGLHGKLTLVSAPAGFGKTTLVSSWLQVCERPSTWLSLDKEDNELNRFFVYLMAALKKIDGDLGKTAVSHLQSLEPPQFESILTSLINDIAQLVSPILLVLDDYHVINEKIIHEGLGFLLEHMPPQLHLVIITRANPPLPLAKWRARGEMCEVRARDLRFTAVDVTSLLNEQMGLNLNQANVEALVNRTEGWIAGLQLAALSLQDHPEPTAFIQSFTGSNQYILDYLLEEVLQHQPLHIQTFLMQTAVLTRLSGSLCNAVVDQNDSQEILEQLQQSNLFIMSLDDTREWFRYHHLFADLLTHRLRRTQPDHIVNLHNRASQWYEENGFITDALHHAHAVADYDRATQLIVAHAWQKMSNGEPNTVASWINAMPSEQVHTHPFLAISKAWNLLYLMQFQKIEPYLISASQLLNDSDSGTEYQHLHGELFAIQARIAHYQGNSPQAIQLAHQALEHLKIENTFVRGLVLTVLGDALRDEEKIEAAISAYTDALEMGRAAGDSLVLMGVAYRLGDLYAECGKLQQAESLLQNVLNRFPSDLPATGFVLDGLGTLAYKRNELETAVTYLKTAVSRSQNKLLHTQTYVTLSQTYLARENTEASQAAFDEAVSLIRQWAPHLASSYLAGLQIHRALLMGDVVLATHLQKEFSINLSEIPAYHFEFQALTRTRLLIAQGRLQSAGTTLSEAHKLLEQIEETAVSSGRLARVMETQMLRALAYHAMGQQQLAKPQLAKALVLAEAEGYVRIFLDEGTSMARLLKEMPITPFISHLLAAFPQVVNDKIVQRDLIKPLSNRELEVLHLVADDQSYKEIAAQLTVSLNTVRYHMKNIYTKLGVSKRAQAIAKAKDLDLL